MAKQMKMPVKTATLDFKEDGYPGFKCERRLNVSMGVLRRIREAATEAEGRESWLEVFTSWNFVDEEGREIPHSVDGFDAIPGDLFDAMIARGQKALKEAALPLVSSASSSEGADAPTET